jgi:hypothetical protein
MPETFFGPWRVVVGMVNSHYSQSFTVAGSDNADDRYPVAFGEQLNLVVRGTEWTLQVEWFPFGEGATYQPSDVRRTTKFVPGEGLVVQLDAGARLPGRLGKDFDNLTLLCTSIDPELSPVLQANPYDFTIPER